MQSSTSLSAGSRSLAAAVVAALAASAPVLPTALSAQAVPAVGGVELRTGLTLPEHATAALGFMLEGDIGYLLRPQLRLITGVSRFAANIDREPGDNEGSFVATGIWLGGRYDFMAWNTLAPYARASVTLQHVRADAWDPDVDRLLDGINAGLALAAGGRYAIDSRGRLSATLELRRTFINNLNHTSAELGIRWMRRGAYAYVPDAIALAPAPGRPAQQPATPVPPAPAAGVRPGDQPPPATQQPPTTLPMPDTAAARRQAEEAARLAEERARQLAMAEQESARMLAEAAAERAEAREARLRQGLRRAVAVMTSVESLMERPDHFVVTLGGGAFASGAATLSDMARGELRALANVLSGYPGHIVIVEGHTDSQGDAAANQVLSEDRAAAVRAGLIVEGVDALWTTARGFGASRPVADNASAAGRAVNRRVEVRIARVPCDGVPQPTGDGALACAPRTD